MSFLKLIRFPNLLIVVFTQYLLQYLVLIPEFERARMLPLLDHFHFFLLVLSTVIIAAGGYMINDLEDQKIDLINKPEKMIVGKEISVRNTWIYYWVLTVCGLLISLYLAFYVQNIPLVFIYPFAVLLLFLYSKYLKKSVLIGNLIVSLFCAFVAGVVLFAEKDRLDILDEKSGKFGSFIFIPFLFYMVFAFFSTLFREIIKDLEDLKGDVENGCKTLPIVFGINVAKVISIFTAMGLLILVWTWSNISSHNRLSGLNIYLLVGILIPILVAILLVMKAETKKQFHQVSQLAKYIMLSGLIYLILIAI